MIVKITDGRGAESPIEKIKMEAYREGYLDGTDYIKEMVISMVSNDAIAITYQTSGQYRKNLIEWIKTL